MNKHLNYYSVLEVSHLSSDKEIKKSYYKLSFKYHPDRNKDIDPILFNAITEAYKVLSDNNKRVEYDNQSIYGKDYNEELEMFDVDYDFDYDKSKQKLEDFKNNQVNNIQIEVDDSFSGNLKYERWIRCKTCDGNGKDLNSKIEIKDNSGKVIRTFDPDDGCDFCEGTGKEYNGQPCSFCFGKGQVGLNRCGKCKGEGRILGLQKANIKLSGEITKFNSMGHFSKSGKVGYLLVIKK